MTNSNKPISFQGMPGANSDMACRRVFPGMDTLPCRTFEEAFQAVHDGNSVHAMIPIENSIAGRVADIHHLLPDSGLFIIGEYFLRLNHHLLAITGATEADLTHVHSHIHALNQSRNLIKELGLIAVEHVDTAGAAIDVMNWGDKTQAAIGSELAAELDGLVSLRQGVEDSEHNTTRFIILSKEPETPEPTRPDLITSLVFRVRNVPAALFKAMGGFATNGVNITKLESYLRGDFVAAQFYADVEGHPDQRPLKLALQELAFFTHEVKILGTYPGHEHRKTITFED